MDSRQFEKFFLEMIHKSSKKELIERLGLAYQADISHFMDLSGIQDSFRFRARHLGWKIAHLLIDEKGDLQKEAISELIAFFSHSPFVLGPRRESDALIYRHLRNCLESLASDPQVWGWIRRFSTPLSSKRAQEVIQETLWPSIIQTVETYHVRRAALAAWLTLLRQTVGSCFATAPAILIQQQPQLFFKDLYELLSTGQLKRVLEGKQYAVPLSLTAGKMDLEKPFGFEERLFFSPGLIKALEAARLLPEELSLEQKARLLQKMAEHFKNEKSPETLLRALLLNSVGLTEQDLEEEEKLTKIQITPLSMREGAVYYQRPSLRAQKIMDWKKRCVKAGGAFQALAECSLLRTWEYTIASFCDMKVDFAKWNLYLGLGLQVDQKGGIGEFLYQELDGKLQMCNQEIEKTHQEYESAFFQVQALESLLHRSSGDAQSYRLKGDLTGAMHTMQTALDMRNHLVKKAEALSTFFSSLIEFYVQNLPLYFQEVFDPAVPRTAIDLYEDSPAGFRLLYKHRRSNASLWTLIYTGEEYIQCLRLFFSAVENEILLPSSLDSSFLSELTTKLIQFIQEDRFLSGSLARSVASGRSAPWNYISGGTMQALVQSYFSRNDPLTEVAFLPKSEEDLLDFLLNLKEELKKTLLIHSPTHAFILHLDQLSENAKEWIQEDRRGVEKWKLNEEKQEYLAHLFSERLSSFQKPLFLHLFRQTHSASTLQGFRSNLLECLQSMKEIPSSFLDAFLYEQTPLLENREIKEALYAILNPLCKKHELSFSKAAQMIEMEQAPFLGGFDLVQIAKSIILQISSTPFSNIDWDLEIGSIARSSHVFYPHPILFADTNWSGWFFGFVFNAFTKRLELWRLTRSGLQGFPMTEWNLWFSPSNKIPWVVLPRSNEYLESGA